MLESRIEGVFEAFKSIMQKKGMHVVMISQSEVETFTP